MTPRPDGRHVYLSRDVSKVDWSTGAALDDVTGTHYVIGGPYDTGAAIDDEADECRDAPGNGPAESTGFKLALLRPTTWGVAAGLWLVVIWFCMAAGLGFAVYDNFPVADVLLNMALGCFLALFLCVVMLVVTFIRFLVRGGV